MGVEADLTGILREVVQFLESLCDIQLPVKIENERDSLLERSRAKLVALGSSRGSASPEPYLEMNAGKGLLLFPNSKEIAVEEYVGIEEQQLVPPSSHQDYYETFQEIGKTSTEKNNKTTGSNKATCCKKIAFAEETEEKLLEIYKTFTPATTMNKAHKFGTLDQKVEKKSFGFVRGNIRSCWIGLVGTHLLIYNSEKDKQPPEICSIREYTGRPAANGTFKDQEHTKSAFEIFCPGNKTLQFIAKNPAEMEEWLAAIARINLHVQDRDSGMYDRSLDEKIDIEQPEESPRIEDRYQDVLGLIRTHQSEEDTNIQNSSSILENGSGIKVARSDSDKKKDSSSASPVSPPALPARIPRQLPSVPSEQIPMPSYEALIDGYEEDDIYHKIEDIRENVRSYENVKADSNLEQVKPKEAKKKEVKKKKKEENTELELYDDVERKQSTKKKESKKKKRISILQNSSPKEVDPVETYDDVQALAQNNQSPSSCKFRTGRESLDATNKDVRSSFTTYDDVFQPSSIVSIKSQTKIDSPENKDSKDVKEAKEAMSPDKSPTKSPQKRSFLDRVRNRKESPKKEEKKRSDSSSSSGKKTEKKEKRKASSEAATPQISDKEIEPDLPTYDDVSEYLNDLNTSNVTQRITAVSTEVDDFSNYTCPPPPRPIYIKPMNPVAVEIAKSEKEPIEEVYDDIANYTKVDTESPRSETEVRKTVTSFVVMEKITQSVELKSTGSPTINTNWCNGVIGNGMKICSPIPPAIVDNESHDKENNVLKVDTEHYQIPRSNCLTLSPCTRLANEQEEQLYDDIAILAEFRSKQRDTTSYSNNDVRNSVKKPWTRFGSGKKLTTPELSAGTTKNRSYTDLEDASDTSTDKTDSTRPNKLQKLINKMESTLGKQSSTKSVSPVSSKTHTSE